MYAPIFAKRGRPTPSYEDVRYNGSLMLGNSYVALGQATRLPQNYKPVGGFHIHKTTPPLPEVMLLFYLFYNNVHFDLRNRYNILVKLTV